MKVQLGGKIFDINRKQRKFARHVYNRVALIRQRSEEQRGVPSREARKLGRQFHAHLHAMGF